jgi:very-short-patch-repair endonuclease
MVKYTINDFIKKANNIHNNKYEYSKSVYKNSRTKIKIICQIHGIFEQLPSSHLNGNGCPYCKGRIKNNNDFIKKSNEIHHNKYDYSLINYINSHTKIKIICPIHGTFKQKPHSHINQQHGCPICSGKNMTTNIFIKNSNEIHHNKYNYFKSRYIKSKSKIIITCKLHGDFEQRPNDHLQGYGCPKCNESKGEKEIRIILKNNNINYQTQKKFNGCNYIRPLKFDFYLPDYNTCIEFDGEQHYKIKEFFGGEKEFKNIQQRDQIKNVFCIENNINLLRIKYNENISKKINTLFI